MVREGYTTKHGEKDVALREKRDFADRLRKKKHLGTLREDDIMCDKRESLCTRENITLCYKKRKCQLTQQEGRHLLRDK